MKLTFDRFLGIAPRMSEHLLPVGAAVTAQNCRLMSGGLAPWFNPSLIVAPSPLSTWPPYRSLFRYQSSAQRDAGTEYWLTWLADVQATMTPIVNDTFDRCYFTGDGVPKVTSSDIIDSGSGAYPQVSYAIGVPAPITAPTVAVSGVATSDDPTEAISRSVVYTFVNEYGEESAPSPVSDIVTTLPGQQIDITALETTLGAIYRPMDEKRIYLTNTGTSGTAYQLAETLAPAATVATPVLHEFTDFGEVLSSEGWLPPPDDMIGLVALPWGALAGFAPNDPLGGSGNAVYISAPYQVHAWLLEQAFAVTEQIIALAAFGNSLLVLTNGLPTITTGTDPSALSIERLETGYACASRRGVANVNGDILYPCSEGIASVSVGGSKLITEGIITEREWKDYYPATMVAGEYAGHYVAFFDSSYDAITGYTNPRDANATRGGLVFNPKTGQLIVLSGLEATALHAYLGGDRLGMHVYAGSTIRAWDGDSASPLTYTWKSGPQFTPYEASFGAMRVYADNYPVTAKVYLDGALIHTQAVASEEAFRLPPDFTGRRWQVQIEGTHNVSQVFIAGSMEELDRIDDDG